MAAYDFPDTAGKPTDGSFEYTAPDGTLYEWNGYAWVVPTDESGGGSGGAARVLTQVLPPSPAEDGDMYWCTDDGRLYLYYDDADTKQWVDASPDGGGNNVEKLIAGDNITLSPADGKGVVTINSTGGGSGGPTTPGVRYQSGTWTPGLSAGSWEINPERCFWSRTGNTISLSGYGTKWTNSGNGQLEVTDLPYSVRGNASGAAGGNRAARSAKQVSICFADSTTNNVSFLCGGNENTEDWLALRYIDKGNTSPALYWHVTYDTDDTTFVPGTGSVVTEDIQGTGGSGGGGSTEIYGTAKAWALVQSDGTVSASLNIASADRTADTGIYQVTFETPMSTADYAVVVSTTAGGNPSTDPSSGSTRTVGFFDLTTTGFKVVRYREDGVTPGWGRFTYAVYNEEPITVSGGGGGTTVNYNGASAWGDIAQKNSDGPCVINGSQNVASVTRNGQGWYDVVFEKELSNSHYSVQVTAVAARAVNCCVYNLETTGFRVTTHTYNSSDNAGVPIDNAFVFTVQSSNAIAPQSGVGADAWGTFSGTTGDLQAGMNIKSTTRTSVGDYKVEFITEMPSDSEYSVTAAANSSQAKFISIREKSTSGFRVVTRDGSENISDAAVSFTVHASSTVTPTYTWKRDGTTLKTANDGDSVNINAESIAGLEDDIKLAVGEYAGTARPLGLFYTSDTAYQGPGIKVQHRNSTNSNAKFFQGVLGTNPTVELNADGSASFAGTAANPGVQLNAKGSTFRQGAIESYNTGGSSTDSLLRIRSDVGGGGAVQFQVKANGDASCRGSFSPNGITFNLEPDDPANYVSTMVDGEEEQVYSGPTLDVKALLLTLQTAAARIATLEAKVQTLESDHTTLMNNNNNGGGY